VAYPGVLISLGLYISACPTFLEAFLDRTRAFLRGDRWHDGYYDSAYYDGYASRRYYGRPGYRRYRGYGRSPHLYADRWFFDGPILADKITIDEDDAQFTIAVILPGYHKNDIHVSAFQESIKIRAEAPTPDEKNPSTPATRSIDQIINLNTPIEATRVHSEYLNGVITIIAPKKLDPMRSGVRVPVK